MFEIFIALFGIIYFAGRLGSEKSKSKAFDRRMEEWKNKRNDIKKKYVANPELEKQTKEYILCGKNYEEICNLLAEDFEYILGDGWKEKLTIHRPGVYLNSAMHSFSNPTSHVTWTYHLLLSKQGKIDSSTYYFGFFYFENSEEYVRFVERVEKNLSKTDAQEIRFGLEPLQNCPNIVIESLSFYDTRRLW